MGAISIGFSSIVGFDPPPHSEQDCPLGLGRGMISQSIPPYPDALPNLFRHAKDQVMPDIVDIANLRLDIDDIV